MSDYERLAKIIGPHLMEVVERELGGKQIRIRKRRTRVDLSQYYGKPLTLRAIMQIFSVSMSTAKRLMKNIRKS